jgi:hypothetical protein
MGFLPVILMGVYRCAAVITGTVMISGKSKIPKNPSCLRFGFGVGEVRGNGNG